MTFELMKVLKEIDLALIDYGMKDKSIASIAVTSEMALNDYKDKTKNCYHLLVIKDLDDLDSFIDLIEVLNDIGRNIPISSYSITSPTFETQKDYPLKGEKDVSLDIEVYTEQEFKNLSPTLKHLYGKRYRHLLGIDYLNTYQTPLSLDELTTDVFNFRTSFEDDKFSKDTFFLFEEFLKNIYEYCQSHYSFVPSDKMIFLVRLLGIENVNQEMLYLLKSIVSKNYEFLVEVFKKPQDDLVKLLYLLENSLKGLDSIYSERETLDKVNLIPIS